MTPERTVRREPAINLPPLLTVFIAVLVAIQAGRGFLTESTDLELLFSAGFVPVQWSVELGWTDAEAAVREAVREASDPASAEARAALVRYLVSDGSPHLWSFLTYALLHGSWLHVGTNCIWLAAFGTPVVRRCGARRACLLTIATALGGALLYWISNPGSWQVMIGASGVVSGFMGAAARFAFDPRRSIPKPGARPAPARGASLLGNRNALLFVAIWFATNLLAGLFAAPLGIAEGGIAWQAHVGGFLVGLILFPLLDPLAAAPGAT